MKHRIALSFTVAVILFEWDYAIGELTVGKVLYFMFFFSFMRFLALLNYIWHCENILFWLRSFEWESQVSDNCWLQTGIRVVFLAVNWKTGAVKSAMYGFSEDSTCWCSPAAFISGTKKAVCFEWPLHGELCWRRRAVD